MNGLEIVLLFLGALVFVAGYVFPEKKDKLNEDQKTLLQDEVKRLTGEEVAAARQQLDESIEESVKYAVERSERSLERISNEKVLAVNDYAESVLSDIRKNHDEVVFMYDMLSGKQENLKETAREVDKTSREAREIAMDALVAAEDAQQAATVSLQKSPEPEPEPEPEPAKYQDLVEALMPGAPAEEKYLSPDAFQNPVTASEGVSGDQLPQEDEFFKAWGDPSEENGEKRGPGRPRNARHTHGAGAVQDISALLAGLKKSPTENRDPEENVEKEAALPEDALLQPPGLQENSNSRILKLHERGLTPVAIAKELGLGVGEVQLVIGLYEGR